MKQLRIGAVFLEVSSCRGNGEFSNILIGVHAIC
jgi:hypothetical protein